MKAGLLILIALLLVGGGFYYFKIRPEGGQVACTMEAKLCPDGSYVGREGPMCEFAECPGGSGTEGWKTVTDSLRGISFKYPENISTNYITAVDWPPKVEVTSEEVVCTEAGEEIASGGETTMKIIGGQEYCVTKVTEGAAGSTYTQYAYGTEIDDRFVFFTFSLRTPQCANYDNPEKASCEAEQKNFSVDGLINKIAGTAKLAAENITYVKASADMIVVDLPFPGAVVGKDFTVVGKARGGWYFEASFPIDVLDKDGKVLFQTYATAQGEWMTSEFVPFKSQVIKIPASYTGPATLVLHKDNASGLPEHDASVSFPITIEY